MTTTRNDAAGLTERVADLQGRMREFIDSEVCPQEKVIDSEDPPDAIYTITGRRVY